MLLFSIASALLACRNGTVKDPVILNYDKKYIQRGDVREPEEEQEYFIFQKDGTGTYHYYRKFTLSETLTTDNERIFDYTITFRYLIRNDTVVCFYDSVEFHPADTERDVSTSWSGSYRFSKNILTASDSDAFLYICEDYLPQIPNFSK